MKTDCVDVMKCQYPGCEYLFIILQTTDLTSVHLGVKFSCRFTLREIKERWYSLLYDPVISK